MVHPRRRGDRRGDEARAARAVLIDAEAGADPLTRPGRRNAVLLPNNHLSYAITWFGMAAALAGVFAAFAISQRRGNGE